MMMNKVISFLHKLKIDKSFQDISWVFLGNVSFKVLAIIPFTILTRVLGPTEYGKFSLAISLAALAGELTDLGTNATFVRFGSEFASRGNKAGLRSLISITLRWKLIWGSIICVGGLILSDWLSINIFHDESLKNYIMLTFIGGFSAIFTTQEFVIFQSLQEFKKLGIYQILNGSINLFLVLIIWLIVGLNSYSAFMAYFLAPYFLVLITIKLIPEGLINISDWDGKIFRQLTQFFKWMFVASIGYLLFNQVNIIMLGIMASQSEVGYYNAAFRIGILTQLLTGSFDNVITAKFSSNSTQYTKKNLKQAFNFIGIILLVLIGVGIFSETAVSLLAGDQFHKSSGILQVLLVWVWVLAISIPFTRTLFAQNKTRIIALSTIAGSLLMIGANLFFIPQYEALGAVFSLILSQLFVLVIHASCAMSLLREN